MTVTIVHDDADSLKTDRVASRRRFLMCRPDHFEVTYAINPWMDPSQPVDRDLAVRQWEALKSAYLEYGHQVDLISSAPGLPDMVFAANGGTVFKGKALASTFFHEERRREGSLYQDWFVAAGYANTPQATHHNEGEGDFLVAGTTILAGTGFRTSVEAHIEVREFFDASVVSLELVNPHFYHLDTALCVLNDSNVAYYPAAFSPESQDVLRELFPDAIIATEEDAAVLGLNALSDGRNVFLTHRAEGLISQLSELGYNPVGIDLSELLKAGGSVKCCTLEIRP